MGKQEPEPEPEQKELADGGKRKLDPIELAKQRAQEIAARITSNADPKRPRLGSDNSSEHSISAPPSLPVPFGSQPYQHLGLQGTRKKITVPNGKVGVVIGKGGETIKMIQLQSGAKIQITKDLDADPHSLTRDVDVMGTSEQISRAEELINDVIAETDVGGSASSTVQGLNTKQSGAEQFAIKVPNDKVGLLIGKGGETIKYMQSTSGARIQIIPLHLPPGDPATERTVYINGTPEQIEAAKELVNDVIGGKRILNPSGSSGYAQPVYPSAGNWAQPGQPLMQQLPQYAYAQSGNQPTVASYYGNYNQQISWDPTNPAAMAQIPQQMMGYGYYGQQSQMGSAPPNPTYGYSQTSFASNSYDHSYSQQAPNCSENLPTQTEQQKPYATSGYGSSIVPTQPDGGDSSQSTQAAYTYPPSTHQSGANPQTYWTSSSFAGQEPPQTGYNQTGYPQTTYGGPHASNQATYGQAEYPHQSSEPVNYGQGTQLLDYGKSQLEVQSQSLPSNNGHSQSLANGVESHDGNSNQGHGSNPSVQETVPSQS